MNGRIVIFGCGDIAELAWHYFTTDTDYEVAAFTVDGEFRSTEEFHELPVVDFAEVEKSFSPDSHGMFVALSYNRINKLRAQKAEAAKAKGYSLASYVSSRATYLAEEAPGENSFILENNTVQPFARIGRNVTLWSGNHIGHHAVIGDHCFITSHVVVSGGVTVGPYSFLGVNATIRDHVSIGENCVIGAGALILTDTPADAVYITPAAAKSPVPSSRLKNL